MKFVKRKVFDFLVQKKLKIEFAKFADLFNSARRKLST